MFHTYKKVMSQKRNLDLPCFVFPKGKGCCVHLYVKKNIDKFDKIRELPTNGGLPVPPPPLPRAFLHTLHLPAGYVPDGGLHLNEIFLSETKMQQEINRINH